MNTNKFTAGLCTLIFSVFLTNPTPYVDGFAGAETLFGPDSHGYPYDDTFTTSAYYSPLPCQEKYATGSYAGDIRLNGSGVNSADGTPVYPGMIASPSKYAFGIKMYIPGIGITAVHDRGGAIVTAGNRGQEYDRLDIWMGYGDKGLKRALNWGKRDVDVTVYGISDAVEEDVSLWGYTPDEAIPNECVMEEWEAIITETTTTSSPAVYNVPSGTFLYGLEDGDTGTKVTELQEELISMNFYKVEPSGVYDDLTVHAVYKFQQAQGIVASEDSIGAGYFGPSTRGKLNSIVAMRGETQALIAEATNKATTTVVAMSL